MGSYNSVTLMGNLGRDAELRYTPGGVAVATLNLATTDTWTDRQGEKQEQTDWHRIILWGKQAESLAEYLTKGKSLLVIGSLHTRSWQDRDGNKKYTTEVKASRVVFAGGAPSGGRQSGAERQRQPSRNVDPAEAADAVADELEASPLTDDGIPF